MAMQEPFYIVVTLTPAPGKAQYMIEQLQPLAEYVKANEPGCLQYEVFQPTGPGIDPSNAPVLFIELWKDMASLGEHRKGELYKALNARAAEEQLLVAAPDVKVLQSVGGFGYRA